MEYDLSILSVLIFGLCLILCRSIKRSNDRPYIPSIPSEKNIHSTVSYARPWGGASRLANAI